MEGTKISHVLLPYTYMASPIINIPHYSGTFVTIDEPALTNYPKSIVNVRVHSWSFFFNYFIVVHLQLSAFSPHRSPPTPAKPTSLPCFHPPPCFCPCVFYSSSWKPFSPLSPPPPPLAIVRLFLISMSLVIFCLHFSFVDYVPVKGEIIWYLSLTAWLISFSIMPSSSIHAVTKGRSSFFLCCVEFHCVNVP